MTVMENADLLDYIPVAVYRTTPEGRILLANRALVEMLGFHSFQELAERDLETAGFEPSYDRKWFRSVLEREGEIRGLEAVWRTADGRSLFVSEDARAVRDDAGAVLYYDGTVTDITDRKRTEQRLHASEERCRDLVENAEDVVFTIDLAGRILAVNKAAERLIGYGRDELLRMDLASLLPPEELAEAFRSIQEKLAGAPPRPRVVTCRSRDGRPVTVEVTARLLFENGRPSFLQGIARDATERIRYQATIEAYARELKNKNEELLEALAAARVANEAKSRFLANMSHEIRTPMNGVAGMTDLLLATELDAEQREYAESIRNSSEALITLINDILDISKIEAGKLELHPTGFNLRELAQSVAALLRAQAARKGIALTLDVDERLPEAFTGDAGRLRQILMNLAGNAVKFTEHGTVSIRVSAAARDGGKCWVEFRIEDTGIGIAPESAPRLFQSFTQADSATTRRSGGTGLGLAISKELVEMMGGRIGFESEPGRGSTFWFSVPLAAAPGAAPPVQTTVAESLPQAAGTESSVLLAEDNDVNRTIALRMLARAGYNSHAVGNGRLAVEAALSGRYQAVLMDVHMPELDGFEATREIRAREAAGQHLPIIAMTARALPGDREKCLEAGMDDYITKPVRRQELLHALRWWLRPEDRPRKHRSRSRSTDSDLPTETHRG